VNPREFINAVIDLIRRAPAGGPFHDPVISNVDYGMGGGTFTIETHGPHMSDHSRYLVTFTRLS
jgi:hypothetical protein